MKKRTAPKSSKPVFIVLLIIAILLIASAFTYSTKLKKASITEGCDFTVKSIDDVKTISNEPSLSNDRAYLITVRADKGGECLKVTLTQDDFKRFGISDLLYGNITLSAQVKDLSQEYKVEDDTIFYKIYESTASDDLSQPIPYSMVSIKTTQASALGKFGDPNGQAPTINHLGNFPSGGDVNLMKDVGEWAYVMPEASNIPFGKDPSGNWWVTHMGGIPYYRGYRIDTMAYNRYSVLFTLEKDKELLGSVTMDEQNRLGNLGDVARIKFAGSSLDAVFPSQPAVYYAVVQGLEGTPVENKFKFVSRYRYDNYKSTLEELVNFDNNYFERSWSDISGTLAVTSSPSPVDVYMDNKYLGFTPLTLNDVPIGRHTITAKKIGYYDASQEINLNPTLNKLSIALAKIPPPDVTISVVPNPITQGGSATLSWSTKGEVSTVKLFTPDPQVVTSAGTLSVTPQGSITYTIIASGIGGEKSGSVRLQVNPPPPPPPAPPVRRDPGVGREVLTDKENTLNNVLGLISAESVAPKDCVFVKDSMSVVCRPQYPVAYPEFQILLKAKEVAMQINSGMPEITKVVIPDEIFEGVPAQAQVNIKNAGTLADSFDLSLQSNPALSGGTQQFSLAPQGTTNASIPFSGAVGTYSAKIVLQSRNNPFAKAVKDVNITIKKNPLPGEIQRLEKRTDYLEDLIGQGFSKTIMLFVVGLIAAVLILGVLIIYINKPRKGKGGGWRIG